MADPDPTIDTRRNYPAYDDDFAAWVDAQAAALRDGRFGELDIEHLVDEVEGVGRSEFNAFVSAISIVLLHMMKWDYQPELRSRSWRISISNGRNAVAKLLKQNPSFKSRLVEAMDDAYANIPDEVERETTVPAARLPVQCPYDWDAMMTRMHDFDPDRPWPN